MTLCSSLCSLRSTAEWFSVQLQAAPGNLPSCALCKKPTRSPDIIALKFEPMQAIRKYMQQIRTEAAEAQRMQQAIEGRAHAIDVELQPGEAQGPQQAADVERRQPQEEEQKQGAESSAHVAAASSIGVAAPAASSSVTAASRLTASDAVLYSHPLFFSLQRMELEEELSEARAAHDAILPKYTAIMRQYDEQLTAHTRAREALEKAREDRRAARAARDAAQSQIETSRALHDPLHRARDVLLKHRTVWAVVQDMGQRQANAAHQESESRRAEVQGANDEATAAAAALTVPSLSAQLNSGLHQFDPESHAHWQEGSAAMSAALHCEARLHLLQANATFLRSVLAAANLAQRARKVLADNRTRSAYARTTARFDRRAATAQKLIAQKKEEEIDKTYKINMLRRQVEASDPQQTERTHTAMTSTTSTAVNRVAAGLTSALNAATSRSISAASAAAASSSSSRSPAAPASVSGGSAPRKRSAATLESGATTSRSATVENVPPARAVAAGASSSSPWAAAFAAAPLSPSKAGFPSSRGAAAKVSPLSDASHGSSTSSVQLLSPPKSARRPATSSGSAGSHSSHSEVDDDLLQQLLAMDEK